MAVAALLLSTVVAGSFVDGGDDGRIGGDPRASFTFATENGTVVISHYGGDSLDGGDLYVESGERGRLGNFAGTDGQACVENVTQVGPGTNCRVPNATHERLYVVWENDANRSLILARRPAEPTPTPTPTVVPTGTAGTATPTAGTATPTAGTATPTRRTPSPTASPPTGTTTVPPADQTTTGTATGTTGGNQTGTSAETARAGTTTGG